jgi:hypothetical protein
MPASSSGAVAKTRLHTGERHRLFVHNPILQSLGLEDDEAFNRAAGSQAVAGRAGAGSGEGRSGEFVNGHA